MERKKYTSLATWTVKDLVEAADIHISVPSKKEKVIVPKYQRSLVWSKKAKKAFIDSLKLNFPIGSLLLYKDHVNENGVIIYTLTDGLQRTQTITEYIEKPTQFFDEEYIEEELLENLLRVVSLPKDEANKLKLTKVITAWVKRLRGFKEVDGFSSFDLADEIDMKLDPIPVNENNWG